MPAFIAAASAGLGLYSAGQEKKRQAELRENDARMKRQAAARNRARASAYKAEMSPLVRMRKLALGTTGAIAELRTTMLDQQRRNERTAQKEQADLMGNVAGMNQSKAGFSDYLQGQSMVQGMKEQAVGQYGEVVSRVADTVQQITGEGNQTQLAIDMQAAERRAGEADPYGQWAAGTAASLGAFAGDAATTTTTDKQGNKTTKTMDLNEMLQAAVKLMGSGG